MHASNNPPLKGLYEEVCGVVIAVELTVEC
jgi:hypothetical protein